MDFLNIADKTILVFGVANKKSVAFAVSQVLTEAKANVVYVVQSPEIKASVAKILPGSDIYICDVEQEQAAAANLVSEIADFCEGIAFRLLETIERGWKIPADVKERLVQVV
jgi:enoyl-[acyl-carrier protein] reductase I